MTMTAVEREAYQDWLVRHNFRTAGTALLNAYLDGRRDLLDDHRNACAWCEWCADLRVFGRCSSCGKEPVEAIGPDELGCCGSRVILTPADENARLHREEATDRGFDQILHEDVWTPKEATR